MIWLIIYFHIICIVKNLVYKILYGGNYHFYWDLSFRKGFSLVILDGGKIDIGENVFFNNYCSVCAINSITIGNGTIFGENVKLYDHNHIYSDPNLPIKKQGYTSAPVTIGHHCWIGSNVVILKGVTIGDNCVIGAGCIVYKDVPAGCVVINKQDLMVKQIL